MPKVVSFQAKPSLKKSRLEVVTFPLKKVEGLILIHIASMNDKVLPAKETERTPEEETLVTRL